MRNIALITMILVAISMVACQKKENDPVSQSESQAPVVTQPSATADVINDQSGMEQTLSEPQVESAESTESAGN